MMRGLVLSLLALSIVLLAAFEVLHVLPLWLSLVLCGLALSLDLPYFVRGVAHLAFLKLRPQKPKGAFVWLGAASGWVRE